MQSMRTCNASHGPPDCSGTRVHTHGAGTREYHDASFARRVHSIPVADGNNDSCASRGAVRLVAQRKYADTVPGGRRCFGLVWERSDVESDTAVMLTRVQSSTVPLWNKIDLNRFWYVDMSDSMSQNLTWKCNITEYYIYYKIKMTI